MLSDDDLRAALGTRLPDLHADVEGELDRLLDRAGSRARARRATYVVGLLAAAVVAAVLVFGHDWDPQAKSPQPVDDPDVQTRTLVNRGMFADPAELAPGRYRAQFLGPGGIWHGLKIEMDIPAGWGQDDVVAFATGPGENPALRRIDLFAGVTRVRPDPCSATMVRPDPGPLALARELARLAHTRASAPTPVTVGGFSGYQLRLEAFRTRGSTTRCSEGTALRETGVVSGVAMAQHVPGWTSLIWVLDVGGSQVVINAGLGPRATPAHEAELVRIVESASFVLP